MQPYSNTEIDEAITLIAGDVARRFTQADFKGPAMEALVDQLQRMEAARRSGDLENAMHFATTAQPAFDTYRPSNATSRSKAMLGEVMLDLMVSGVPPEG